MSRDYKPTAQRSSSNNKGNPFITGLLVGLLLGVGISVGVALLVKGTDSPFVAKVTPGATTEVPLEKPDTSAIPKDAQVDSTDKPRFDFYTILPGSEKQVTEQEIKQNAAQATETKESYFLQAGAFQTEQEADNMKAKLALLGMEAIVQTATIPDKGVWHRVRVGPFADIDQINKTRAELSKNGFSTDLIKVNSTIQNQ
ncbi:MAG: SPOR domain-containing protein [Methylophilaceae bacterium]|uniref:SPOR domain-containing protein n=1 Tax=Methylovorus sp. MM2 TaxID=1848038 RepID=UPI0007DEDC3B|nr:SPOR domain-containing protein [Methylovorus sp. MM2]OAM52004.1 sporulation protein [Methylovorus sp. MM2]